ncbi:hypothetical protein BO70DRAFT_360768 [Aspergillus heteromorphus CBS 117.55]|uniref:DUF4139 domain-containing protein n=1 Tax=Aspergillus heteromorphus CBS 117.55 TaxID=1448321 RepID=A0A317WNT9_9EURO|nr:uncharacterized protein BO70DRAFT_360768 [Aspergillus heteromorphus CBS 117.55]PWY85920.1 hypothetical protein BO70DRAFT_360768 [Aspergillus heteromorphus CBS 117.55]
MVYRAEFYNVSSETWRDAKVTLSTSQASFAGLGEKIPSLQAWSVVVDTMDKGGREQTSWENILKSGAEVKPAPVQAIQQATTRRRTAASKPLFGQATGSAQFAQPAAPGSSPAFGQAAPSGSLFGAAASQPPNGQARPSLFGGAPPQSVNPFSNAQPVQQTAAVQVHSQPVMMAMARQLPTPNRDAPESEDDDEEDDADDGADEGLAAPSLEVQDSVKQDYGLTTTYELPGRRTLAPSSVARRHVLAELDLQSMTLAYVIVPKHRAAAFLRAEIKNTSSVSILRGKVGMTIDGTFLGAAQVPSCAPKDSFTLSLGVDPAIQVTYGKPTVRRVSGGFFNKEDAAVFRRVCWVKNTKANAVDVTVLDQVPVSDDERLKVQIVEPKGLEKEGDEVKLTPEKPVDGTARLGQNGEVKWMVRLQPGKDVRLVLEYGAKVPVGTEVSVA